MNRITRIVILFTVCLVSTVWVNFAQAQPPALSYPTLTPTAASIPHPVATDTPQDNNEINLAQQSHLWNLENVDILDVIDEISRETGKNFLVDPAVQGKVTMVSSTPLTSKEVYSVFLSMLQTLGYSAIPSGNNVIKIMPTDQAKQQGAPLVPMSNPGTGDQLVATVIPIRNVDANQLVPILRPMMPNWANISAYTPSNSLILVSSAANVQRMIQIISRVDRANTDGVEIIPLVHANATKLVAVLNTLQQTGTSQTASPNKVVLAADEDNNTILLNGNRQGRLRMRALIAELDTRNPNGYTGNTQVIYLHYQQAKQLAPILSKVAGAINNSKGQENDDNAKAIIVADPSTNSLVISAPPTEMSSLISIVRKLDTRPSEVMVEAIVVEVDEDVINRLGVEWGSVGNINAGTTGVNTSNSNGNYLNNDFQNNGSNSSSGVNPVNLFLPYTGIIRTGNIRIILSALAKNNASNLLSTPDLMVLDNEKAKISVGEQVSIQSGSYANSGSTSTVEPFNTFNRQDVGLELNVTPHITRGNIVSLQISLENDSLKNPANPSLNPQINTSNITTNVLINSGDILVLGGLINNDTEEKKNTMPWLSDIPLVGWAFKYSDNSNQKKNLMIFLRPVIMNTQAQGRTITANKYNYVRNQQMLWIHGDRTSNPEDTLLPYWGPQPKVPSPFSNVPPANPAEAFAPPRTVPYNMGHGTTPGY